MRYSNSKIFINGAEQYYKYFADRDVRQINTLGNSTLKKPSAAQLAKLTMLYHTWKDTDRFYNLAYKYYGSQKYWWLIPLVNVGQLESDYEPGDILFVPTPLEKLLNLCGAK